MAVAVQCECEWSTSGNENQVGEAMQVHKRQIIHGTQTTPNDVPAKAKLA